MPDNQSIADIILRWIVDKKSQGEALKALQSIQSSVAGSGKSTLLKSINGNIGHKEKTVLEIDEAINKL